LLGFESHAYNLDAEMSRALAICQKFGGSSDAFHATSWTRTQGNDGSASSHAAGDGGRSGVENAWRAGFMRMGYTRDILCAQGVVSETFETAITWDRFERFHTQVFSETLEAVKKHCGDGMVTCRFTHVYTDGPALYYSVVGTGRAGQEIEQWQVSVKI
jgi:alkyldihydroxyacetonephosphate synthase